ALLSDADKDKFFFRFNVDGLLRGDYQSRMRGYAVGRQNGFLSANDVRSLENMDLIPDEEGGNIFCVNGNLVRLSDIGAAYRANGDT
ncbi:MAG: phage portal protein, partial [Clostridia bacterium]|nr:phage portal protein [Clostridia bacterium]